MKWDGERVVPTDIKSCIDTFQQHMVRYLWVLPWCKDKEVLDAACGTGYGTNLLASVARIATGVDVSLEAIYYATKTYKGIANDENLYYFVGNLEEMESFKTIKDVVVSFETIEHLEDPKKFLEWCKSTAPTVIGSIPISCPTKFHKHVLNTEQIRDLVGGIFSKVSWWYQDEMNITPGIKDYYGHGMILFKGER